DRQPGLKKARLSKKFVTLWMKQLGRQIEIAYHGRWKQPLKHEVVDRHHQPWPRRRLISVKQRRSCLPVMAMHHIGPKIDRLAQLKRAAAEEREPQAIVPEIAA